MHEIIDALKWAIEFSVRVFLLLIGIAMTGISIIGTVANIREKNFYGVIVSISFLIVALLIFKIT